MPQSIQFVEADIFVQDLGQECFALVSCFGNSISDFPIADFAKLAKKIARALKAGRRFVLDYRDGKYEFIQGRAEREGVYQESPERITYRFKEYLPEIGASVKRFEMRHAESNMTGRAISTLCRSCTWSWKAY